MDNKICAFFRGINVNGINIKMNDLKEAFTKMGYSDVWTVLATGNVIFSLEGEADSAQQARQRIENTISKTFDYDCHVLLRSAKELQDILASANSISLPEGFHHYLLLCDDPALPSALKQVFDSTPQTSGEQFIPLTLGAFWIVEKGSTLTSAFGAKVLGSKQYKSVLTSRNINTIQKIAALMKA